MTSSDGDSDGECGRPKPKKAKTNKTVTDGISKQDAIIVREANVYLVPSREDWEKELRTQNQYIVAFFTGQWCGPAQQIKNFVINSSNKCTKLRFLKLEYRTKNSGQDSDEDSEYNRIFQEMGVHALPTFLFLYNGTSIEKLVGYFPEILDIRLQHYDAIAS